MSETQGLSAFKGFLHDGQPTYFSKLRKKTLIHSFGELPLMQQLYGNILADAPCLRGVIHGPVVAGFFLGNLLEPKWLSVMYK